eukprot:CAMPEP_0184497172 /NCGR_PEP_ID=MMETSP0113_2-20130426/35877_1 /TAXON_ID=91329 /ORGANISM="Norrisiella sphaerica, Strain BC52" /LENGTH=41 /DNA_ID= /DNA_START= /DNA_END= /DNA_ORIENTATION=
MKEGSEMEGQHARKTWGDQINRNSAATTNVHSEALIGLANQ